MGEKKENIKKVKFDKQLQKMLESASCNYDPEKDKEQEKRKPVDEPQLPNRLKQFRPIDSQSTKWTALYENIKNGLFNGCLLALYGKRGPGKSQMGVCLIRHCCANGRTALYKKAMDMFLRIRMAMKESSDSEYKAIEEYIKPFLLVIDAFEVRGETPFEDRLLNHIIDKRYDELKSTIIISNDKKEDFKSVLGESIVDRMRETGGMVELNWESFRVRQITKDKG